jgi:hypothetical protein
VIKAVHDSYPVILDVLGGFGDIKSVEPAAVLKRMLSRFADVEDFEHNGVLFKTNVPWRAPKAYLHILYPPASADLIEIRKQQLNIPDDLANFYAQFNGVSLFSGTLEIYGLFPDSYLLNRGDWRCRVAFNLTTETTRWRPRFDEENVFGFGSYSYDRSPICIARESNSVVAFDGKDLDVARSSWNSFDAFIESEVERLGAFFDEFGRTSFPEEALLPSAKTN